MNNKQIKELLKESQKCTIPGSLDGDRLLNEQLPDFLKFYENNDGTFSKIIDNIVQDTLDNHGFAQKILKKYRIPQGEIWKITICGTTWVYVNHSNDITMNQIKTLNEKQVPSEFYLTTMMMIEDKELVLDNKNLLVEHMLDVLSETLKADNKLCLSLLRSASIKQECDIIFHEFDKDIFNTISNKLKNHGKNIDTLLVGKNVWKDISEDPNYIVNDNEEQILQGFLGYYKEAKILSDIHLHPMLQSLRSNECFLVSNNLGEVGLRKEIESRFISQYVLGRPAKGFFIETIKGMAVTDCKSVVRAVKK